MVESKHNDPLLACRERIDRIDADILRLLNQRMEAALEIGRIKKERDLPVYAPEREKEVLGRISAMNSGPLSNQAVESVFQAIIHQVRSTEQEDHDAT